MKFRNLFQKKPVSLEGVLEDPDRFTIPEIVETVLQAASKWLDCTPAALRSVGSQARQSTNIAPSAARQLAELIKAREITTLPIAKGHFLTSFDNMILPHYRRSGGSKRRIDQLLYGASRWMVHDDELSNRLPQQDRLDAYASAFTSMSRKMTVESFTFEHAAGVFLREIYHKKCIDRIRHRDTLKESNRREHVTVYGLPERVGTILGQPPFEMVSDQLALFQRKYPRCYELVKLVNEGWKYAELSEKFNKLADPLRKEAHRCRSKLYTYAQSLRNDG
jgi:DNA-directed RNA polymerase specialized sigma24 family protein